MTDWASAHPALTVGVFWIAFGWLVALPLFLKLGVVSAKTRGELLGAVVAMAMSGFPTVIIGGVMLVLFGIGYAVWWALQRPAQWFMHWQAQSIQPPADPDLTEAMAEVERICSAEPPVDARLRRPEV